MNQAECDRWNAKHSEFFVTRWSITSGRTVLVGKPHPTIQAALIAAERADKRNSQFMHFIDSVRPKAA